MCKCCQSCLETIWWHLIEKQFCYDESIALYEVPEKQEKNNNMFENMAFYDSVSVIAGRAVVTIEPLPAKINNEYEKPKLECTPPPIERWKHRISENNMSKSAPNIIEQLVENDSSSELNKWNEVEDLELKRRTDMELSRPRKNSLEVNKSADAISDFKEKKKIGDLLMSEDPLGTNALLRRRQSKSLYLKIVCVGDQCREVPIIRQSSMPKFYLGSPEDHQIETALFRTPSVALTSPVPVTTSHGFIYDLSSVVQLEKEKSLNDLSLPQVHDSPRRDFKDKLVKLKRIKSAVSAFQSHHI